jgi:hypothetical protein
MERVSPLSGLQKKSSWILNESEIDLLDWKGSKFSYLGMFRSGALGDGSCFFHSIIQSHWKGYADLGDCGNELRTDFVKRFRGELAELLVKYYPILSRGALPMSAKEYPRYELFNLQEELRSGKEVDNMFLELISEVLGIDIYLLHYEKRDIYAMGNDDEILIKNRPSIVLIYLESSRHYESVGVITDSGERLMKFLPDCPFIQALRLRRNEKSKAIAPE